MVSFGSRLHTKRQHKSMKITECIKRGTSGPCITRRSIFREGSSKLLSNVPVDVGSQKCELFRVGETTAKNTVASGSDSTPLNRMKRKSANQSRDFDHKLSKKCVESTRVDTIIVGDLNVKQMRQINRHEKGQKRGKRIPS